ncbi:MAG: FkbM family methyltransferase [Paracoccaceae bacterium]
MGISIGPFRFSSLILKLRFSRLFQAVMPKQYAKTQAKNKNARLQMLADFLFLEEPIIIVDVGANPMDFDAPYKSLLEANLCKVIGFEPQKEAFDKLEKQKSPQETYINAAVGDGQSHIFYEYVADGLQSLYKLDQKAKTVIDFLDHHDSAAYKTLSANPIATRRIDDMDEIPQVDFLKIDIQGGELAVFQNARQKLQGTIAIQTEMRFLRIYEDEPLFGEVDIELNSQGFEMHSLFERPNRFRIPHSQMEKTSNNCAKQLLDTDFIYVRGLRTLDEVETVKLKKLAILADGVFESYDLALYCIDLLVKNGNAPEGLAQKYRQMLPLKYIK